MKRQHVEKLVAECYSTWGQVYYDEYYGPNAPYPPVHLEIIKRLVRKVRPPALLDAGCGPASMLRHFKKSVPERFGFDLTPEMVQEAQAVFTKQGDNPDRIWKGSVLSARSFTPPKGRAPKTYPMILCTGVLPHIRPADDKKVFKNLLRALTPGGVAVVECRNELFSLFTCNRYSYEFFCDTLLRIPEWKKRTPRQARRLEAVKTHLQQSFRMDLPPVRGGKKGEPGYDEVLSRLHNPLVVEDQLRSIGFSNVELIFYHYHCVPPMFSNLLGEAFLTESLGMEGRKDWRGYFMASAFLAIATR